MPGTQKVLSTECLLLQQICIGLLLAIADGAVSSVRNPWLVQPVKKVEAKAWVSSPPRNSLSTAVTEPTWDCLLKSRKEPEQKIFKKPNLVVKPLQLVSEV